MVKKYRVRLNREEITQLETLVNKGKETAYKRRHAQILLKADGRRIGAWVERWEDSGSAGCESIGDRTVAGMFGNERSGSGTDTGATGS